jgi:hypothetical protein
MEDIKNVRVSIGIHSAAAVGMGFVSNFISSLYAGVIGVLVLLACGYLSENVTRKKGMKWWFSNGIFVYVMFWIISWTIFLNL